VEFSNKEKGILQGRNKSGQGGRSPTGKLEEKLKHFGKEEEKQMRERRLRRRNSPGDGLRE